MGNWGKNNRHKWTITLLMTRRGRLCMTISPLKLHVLLVAQAVLFMLFMRFRAALLGTAKQRTD